MIGSNTPANAGILKRLKVVAIVTAVYLLLASQLVGFRVEQLVLAGFFAAMYTLSSATRRWMLGFSIFLVYWIIFDFMKALPNYLVNEVHIGDLYELERSLVGIIENGQTLTPNEFLAVHTYPWLDLLAGVFYLVLGTCFHWRWPCTFL